MFFYFYILTKYNTRITSSYKFKNNKVVSKNILNVFRTKENYVGFTEIPLYLLTVYCMYSRSILICTFLTTQYRSIK